MRHLKYIFLFALCVIYSIRVSYAEDMVSNKKVLVICSYSSDYAWSNLIIDNLSAEVKKYSPHSEMMIEYLSSEKFVDVKLWTERVQLLLNSYMNDLPAAIVLVSDEAWMSYRAVDNASFKNVPLILCGVKAHSITLNDYSTKHKVLTMEDYSSTEEIAKEYKATGVLRGLNVKGMMDIMDKLIPNLNHYVFLTDSRFYGIYLRLLLEDYMSKINIYKTVDYFDARFIDADAMLAKLSNIDPNTGVLLSSWIMGGEGFHYSPKYIYDNMSSRLNAPIFITADIGVNTGGFIGGCFNESGIWGKETADLVNRVIGGIDVQKIPIKTITDSDSYINWNVLTKHRLSIDMLPASTKYINRPESIFVQYKKELWILAVLSVMFVLFLVYVLRSNVKLGRARAQAQQAVKDALEKNQQLELAQETLTQALIKAENADKLKTAFLSNMDYQLRTPLNSIVGFSSMIPSFEEREEIEFAAEQIVENSEKLLKMVEDIIDLSQIESGNVELRYEKINLNDVFEDIINKFADKVSPQVKLLFAPPLMSISITADSSRLSQVLYNLTDNAIKFTQKGEVELGYFAVDNNTLEFYVNDTGVGIEEQETRVIFDRFYKRDSYTSSTGFGLSISKKIIDLFKGEIGVYSKVGAGSRFWFRITVASYSKNL